jgi:hypothetical protein
MGGEELLDKLPLGKLTSIGITLLIIIGLHIYVVLRALGIIEKAVEILGRWKGE